MKQKAINIRAKNRTTKSKIIFIDPITLKQKSLEIYQTPEHCKIALPKYIAKYSTLIGLELTSENFKIECLDKTLRIDKIEIYADINQSSLAHINFSRISDKNELEGHLIVHPLDLKTGKLGKPPFSSAYQNLTKKGIDLDELYAKANTLLISRPLSPKQLDHINDLSDQLSYYTKKFGYLRNTLETVLAIDNVKIEAKGNHMYIVFDVVRFDDGFNVHSSFEIVDQKTGLVASDPDTRLLNPKEYGRRNVLRDELNEYLKKNPISEKLLSQYK